MCVIDGVGHYIERFRGTSFTVSLHKFYVMGSWSSYKTALGGTSAENEVGTKDFFSRHEFSHEKCSENFLKFLSLYFMGPKKSHKIPGKFPAKFPSPKSKEIHRRASAGVATLIKQLSRSYL